ncbi:MAG: protein kinase domain-containing protein [Candidatus Acidiferrales bacterium]
MTDPANSSKDLLVSSDPRRGAARQDTVLLSDVPDAAALLDPAPAPASAETISFTLNLSAPVLAALSQRYDILAEAGYGSMGNVYKARDRETGETVALKLLKPEIASDQAMMDRFKNELLFARKITHKNVCRVHEFNRVAGVAYTSMEFVEGESLRSVLNRFGGLPLRKTVNLSLQICSGLKEAHAQGIVHRDLKPENVMIDALGNVKIMDFGIARSMQAATRLTGSIMGTPAYMAPEQVGGKPIDYRTDIYSLGLMLYEMFTGASAFVADTPIAIAMKQLRESPRPPREVEPTVPVDIERAILKCLEKDPARRFQSVSELEKALRSAAASAPNTTGVARAAEQTTHSSATPIAPAPTPHVSIPLKPAKPVAAYVSILVCVLLVFGALAGSRALGIVKAAEQLAPPASPRAPEPPDFAMDKSIPEKEPSVVPQPASADVAPPVAVVKPKPISPSATKAPSLDIFPAVELPGKPSKSPAKHAAARYEAEPAVVRRAEAASGDHIFVWVARFTRKDEAQETAKKIKDLSLPVVILPRHLPAGEAFAVFTGPYNEKKVSGVVDWLHAQGFEGARIVANPLAAKEAKR